MPRLAYLEPKVKQKGTNNKQTPRTSRKATTSAESPESQEHGPAPPLTPHQHSRTRPASPSQHKAPSIEASNNFLASLKAKRDSKQQEAAISHHNIALCLAEAQKTIRTLSRKLLAVAEGGRQLDL